MAGARRVVVHEDDIGMCHGANVAFAELTRLGICTCGAVMVPCPWFLEIAEMQARDPRLDIGVHLVLTSEWQNYRWRPLTGSSQASGLVDGDGYFWRTAQEARDHAHPEAVEAELRAQVEAARQSGIDITHIDAHMFTVLCPEFFDIYVRLGEEEKVPVLLIRHSPPQSGLVRGPAMEAAIAAADRSGHPVFDRFLDTPWQRKGTVQEDYDRVFDKIEPGLTYMAFHFNAAGDIDVIAPQEKGLRPEEFALFKSETFRAGVAARGLELVGMRPFRDEMRARAAAGSHGGRS